MGSVQFNAQSAILYTRTHTKRIPSRRHAVAGTMAVKRGGGSGHRHTSKSSLKREADHPDFEKKNCEKVQTAFRTELV